MTREEHLAWAKARALQYVNLNDPGNAIASMISDLNKHEAWRDDPGFHALQAIGLRLAMVRDTRRASQWIEGFN